MLFHIAEQCFQWQSRLSHGNGIMRKAAEVYYLYPKKKRSIRYDTDTVTPVNPTVWDNQFLNWLPDSARIKNLLTIQVFNVFYLKFPAGYSC